MGDDHHINVKEMENVLKQHILKVNVSKTEVTTFRKDTEMWKTSTTKKDSLLQI